LIHNENFDNVKVSSNNNSEIKKVLPRKVMEDLSVTTVWDISTESNFTESKYYDLLKQPFYMIVIYSFGYSAVFLCALFGNLMVIMVVIRNKSMHNATNYFIVNLAVADILVAIFCVPITLLSNLYNGK